MTPFIGFIGAGNMASSLLTGLVRQGIPGTQLGAADPDPDKRASIGHIEGLLATADNATIARRADVLVLAVKPQTLETVCRGLTDPLAGREPVIISIAAGITTIMLMRWLGRELPLVRAMPNTPAMLGLGATGLYATGKVAPSQRSIADRLFRGVGQVHWLETEAELDLVTALSGSGPAYFFLFMEALVDGARELGMSLELARALTLQTALGAAHMAQESHRDLAELRRQVTSPGGTTAQGLMVMEREGIRRIAREVLMAAHTRAVSLAHELGDSV
ncbi:MAG TPA: pyrroline-5-carboxylate reductase [Candidatus Acidoferrales bacterium]|nr:pyrroline-5-carboxylate reductase [Candidatus Acidoferrales bacterium]